MKRHLLLSLALMLSAGSFAQDKMNAYSMHMLNTLRSGEGNARPAMLMSDDNGEESVQAFITVDSPATYARLRKLGVQLGYNSNNITTATIPLSAMDAVLAMNDVHHVQIARTMSLHLDHSRSACFVDAVHQGTSLDRPYKGKGVIYGTVDSGIDFQHAAFKDENGNSRIQAVYLPDATGRQTGAKQNYPISVGDYSATLTRGYVYGRDGIGALTTGDKNNYHGTHTATIGAGNPYGSDKYYGMAPEADLILVDAQSLTDVNLANGVAFVFSEAQRLGKPAVVNLSIGTNMGSHSDGESINQMFNSLTGPGRIICTSSGNEGGDLLWINKPAGETVSTVLYNPYISEGKEMTNLDANIDVWGNDGKDFTLRLYARNVSTGKLNLLYDSEKDKSAVVSNVRYMKIGSTIMTSYARVNGNLNVFLSMPSLTLRDGYEMVMEMSGDSEVDAWSHSGLVWFMGEEGTDYAYGSSDNSLNTMGCYENAITVGSYNTCSYYFWAGDGMAYGYPDDFMPTGEVSFFSSYGTDRDGRTQPTVLAPGALISSGYNYYCSASKLTDDFNDMIVQYDEKDGRIHPYGVSLGTSMAAPAVSGIVALWLEQNPLLTPQEVKNILALTSYKDPAIAGEDIRAGFGKINALEGMLTVPTEVVSMVSGNEPIIVATAGGFSVLVPNTDKQSAVEVYNAAGQCVLRGSVSGNVTQSFCIDGSGIYVVKVGKTTKKIVF